MGMDNKHNLMGDKDEVVSRFSHVFLALTILLLCLLAGGFGAIILLSSRDTAGDPFDATSTFIPLVNETTLAEIHLQLTHDAYESAARLPTEIP